MKDIYPYPDNKSINIPLIKLHVTEHLCTSSNPLSRIFEINKIENMSSFGHQTNMIEHKPMVSYIQSTNDMKHASINMVSPTRSHNQQKIQYFNHLRQKLGDNHLITIQEN